MINSVSIYPCSVTLKDDTYRPVPHTTEVLYSDLTGLNKSVILNLHGIICTRIYNPRTGESQITLRRDWNKFGKDTTKYICETLNMTISEFKMKIKDGVIQVVKHIKVDGFTDY